jgi:hypothetical protein
MPLTNAEKQARHRARVKQKLNDLKDLGADEKIGWLHRTGPLRVGLDDRNVELTAECLLSLLSARWREGGCFAADVIAEMGKRIRRRAA